MVGKFGTGADDTSPIVFGWDGDRAKQSVSILLLNLAIDPGSPVEGVIPIEEISSFKLKTNFVKPQSKSRPGVGFVLPMSQGQGHTWNLNICSFSKERLITAQDSS